MGKQAIRRKQTAIPANEVLLLKLKGLIDSARRSVMRQVDNTMTLTYFLVGRYIVEDEQEGRERAAYAEETVNYWHRSFAVSSVKDFQPETWPP